MIVHCLAGLLLAVPGLVVLGYPVGFLYLRDDEPQAHQGMVLWAIRRAEG